MTRAPIFAALLGFAALLPAVTATAQLVVLPAPRLLTTMPMGGKVGSSVEVTITGEGLDSDQSLIILGGTNDVAVAGVPAAPERKQDDQEEKQKQDEKPAQEKKQKDK